MSNTSTVKAKSTKTTKGSEETEPKKTEVEFTPLKLNIKHVIVPIRGISPLIMHAWSEKAKKMMRDKQQGRASNGKEAKDPNADFLEAKYRDIKGRDAVPVIAFKNAFVSAARFAGKELPMTVLRGAIFIHGDTKSAAGEDLALLNFEDCVMREDMVRVGMGTADMRYRPEYKGWSTNLTIEFNANVVSLEQVLGLLRLAGFSVGICDWRPEKDGQYGRFDVDMEKLTATTAGGGEAE